MKKILFIFVILLWGCTKPDLPPPTPPTVGKIFNIGESTVINGQSIYFDLTTTSIHYLTLIDKNSGQVITREKFIGQTGENTKKIYTNSLPKGYLYLVLEDVDRKEIKKTTIIIN
jgi:hypothetical protein